MWRVLREPKNLDTQRLGYICNRPETFVIVWKLQTLQRMAIINV